jgi:broad specificity phosphatase PhoE
VTGAWVEISLLRHGLTVGGGKIRGSLDDPLTPEGWRQMASAVADQGAWDEIVSSPLSRCRDFAESIAEARGVPLRIDERLREYHFGDWEGSTHAELEQSSPDALQRFYRDPFSHSPPGAETLDGFRDRTLEALREAMVPDSGGRRRLLVTHGGVIRIMLCHVRQWSWSRLLEIDVPHASVHRLRGRHPGCEEIFPS